MMGRRPRVCPRSILLCQEPLDNDLKTRSNFQAMPRGGHNTSARSVQRPSRPTFSPRKESEVETTGPTDRTDDVETQSPRQRKGLFEFLRDGTKSLRGTSRIFGGSGKSSFFLPRRPTGGLLQTQEQPPPKEPEEPKDTTTNVDNERRTHKFPSWSTWKDWKKVTLDLYIRLVDRPRDSRVRLKQTIAILPVVKLKPVIDLAYRGEGVPPLSMHLDVKLLDCIKYRVRADGLSTLQVRAKAPLSDPRFMMDVIYERDLATDVEGVKISFRAMDAAFLKAPGLGGGVKFPIRFGNGIKTTLRAKKYLINEAQNGTDQRHGASSQRRFIASGKRGPSQQRNAFGASSGHRNEIRLPRPGIHGPIGVDFKLRCLEYR